MGNILRGNKSTRTPHNLLFVDTETYAANTSEQGKMMIHQLRVGYMLHSVFEYPNLTRQRGDFFKTRNAFWERIKSYLDPRRPLWIVSHNAGFDSTICGLWNEVEEGRAELEFAVTENPPCIIRGKIVGCPFWWVDSMNWFRESIASIGESVGIQKLTMPDNGESEIAWGEYCTRDVEILAEAFRLLLCFQEEHDLGVFKMTIGAQSMQTYRHRFSPMQELTVKIDRGEDKSDEVKQKICLIEPHLVDAVKTLERDAYHQGIGWVFHFGHVVDLQTHMAMQSKKHNKCLERVKLGPIHQLDVNSLYPAMMTSCEYPTRLKGFTYAPSVEELGAMLTKHCVIANVLVDVNYGFVPGRLHGKPGFYHGHFWTTLCTPELIDLWQWGRIKQVSMMAWYDKAMLFDDYVKFFYDLRVTYKENGNRVFANLCKTMLVSLYGKFAQRQGMWITLDNVQPKIRWGEWSEKCPITKKLLHFRGLGNITQMRGKDADLPHTFTAISAHVTSRGRLYMQNLFRKCGIENIFYCNVDSIHCNCVGFDKLADSGMIDENMLGMMKHEGTSSRAEYRGIRNYSLDGNDTVAGLNSTCVKMREREYECLDFQRLNDILRTTPKAEVVITKQDVRINDTFHDGIILADGSTRHYRLEQWETKSIVDLFAESEQMARQPSTEEG